MSRDTLMFGDFLENRWLFFYSFVRFRGRLVFGYFLKTPFVRSYINLVKGSCLEILLKIAGFSQLCKA